MYTIADIFKKFFTHKDFLPNADIWPGTLFTPLQILFCLAVAVFIGFACVHCAKLSESAQKKVYFALWALMLLSEPAISIYDCYAGEKYFVDWGSVLPLWHCSIFLYAAPFAIFGKGWVRESACGYICTLGLLGGAVNFVYPATYLSSYSCISLAGFRTIFYHGAMIFVAVTMLLSGYHSFKDVTDKKQLIIPAIPALIISIPANIVNFTVSGTDYMFFKMESFFFAAIGRSTPDWFTVILVYLLLLIVHATPYLPSYLKNSKTKNYNLENSRLVEV